jgi:hypothetical protein
MSRKIVLVIGWLCLWCLITPSLLNAQMVNPSIDNPKEPFSYCSKPTDVLGVMDGKWGTEVTPEGYLYTGYGELMFFTGNPPEPVNQRVKTLLDGYLPVISYHFEKSGVEYKVTTFAATLDGDPESPLMNFIRVNAKNVAKTGRTGFFGVGVKYQSDVNTENGTSDNRFARPVKTTYLGGYEQAGVTFNPDWVYGFSGDTFLRSDSVMYIFPEDPSPYRMMTLKTGYNYPQNLTPRRMHVLPTTPVGIVNYELHLKPGEEKTLDFKMPYTPIPANSPLVKELREAQFDEYLKRTVNFWNDVFSKGIDIQVPESKVVNTFKANLVYALIARNKKDGFYIQKVNDFQYHAFWLRDASHIVRMYLLSGYFDIARQCLRFFSRWQQPDGNFVSQGGQFDGWGQTMWIYGQYYRFTHDKEFAEVVYPSILKAVDWFIKARAMDPLHLMPETSPGDNENINGHITGHNFWALIGLRNIIEIAKGLGKNEDANRFQVEYNDLYAALMKRLAVATANTGGYIPPGLDGANPPGQDWGNMLTLYPEALFSPFDRMVTATLDLTRAKYEEGIMTYGDGMFLHHYLTIRNTQSELVRNEYETALKEFYALLFHTSSTHAGFEFAIHPWGTRDFDGNLTPHGWYAAEIRALIRNMMVREQVEGFDKQGNLHLLSCISPEWVKSGKEISVQRAPTYFGEVNFDIAFKKGGATLTMNNHFTNNPDSLILHLPWFMDVKSVIADGKVMKVEESMAYLPIKTRKVDIVWRKKADTPRLSFEETVKKYEKEYKEKYEEFLKTGE